MATLTAEQRETIRAAILRRLSADREPTPFSKAEGLTLRIPGGHPGRQWLIDNPAIGRRLMILVEQHRREVL
jgi:hypothetical protein